MTTDVRELLSNAEAIGFKIHNQGIEEARINAEIADLQAKLQEAKQVTAEYTTELGKVYDQAEAAGLKREKVVSVVEGMLSLLVDAGASAPEGNGKAGTVRKARRKKDENVADAAGSTETVSAAPVQGDVAVVDASPSIVPDANVVKEVAATPAETPVSAPAEAPAPAPVVEPAPAPAPAPVAVDAPVAPAAAAPEAAVAENAVETASSDEDEIFGPTEVNLYDTDDELVDGEYDRLEEDYEDIALRAGAPIQDAPVAVEAPVAPPQPEAPAPAAAPVPRPFKRPAFLGEKR